MSSFESTLMNMRHTSRLYFGLPFVRPFPCPEAGQPLFARQIGHDKVPRNSFTGQGAFDRYFSFVVNVMGRMGRKFSLK